MTYNYKRLSNKLISRDQISDYLNSLRGRIVYYKEEIISSEWLRRDLYPEGRFYLVEVLVETVS